MNAEPSVLLEQRAADQRRQIHHSVRELRLAVRDRLDLNAYAREYLVSATAATCVFGLALGYAVAGLFARD